MKPVKPSILNQQKVAKTRRRSAPLPSAAFIVAGMLIGAVAASIFWHAAGSPASKPVASAALAPPAPTPVAVHSQPRPTKTNAWDGPIVYRAPGSPPLHLILVEKATQTLKLYRFDGAYALIKTYACATGEAKGKKRVENDEKTPEGIYFNTKIYRDRKVTVFGDRAFELNYPNPYDAMEGNGGHGIYIHGSNRKVTPYSTNGCVALDNADLADLDKRIDVKETPVIIGETLPYRFNAPGGDLASLLPTVRQAMRPASLARSDAPVEDLTVLAFGDTRLATGRLKDGTGKTAGGRSRLYMAQPSPEMTMLIRREWLAEAPPTPPKAGAASSDAAAVERTVESWRQAWEGKAIEAYIAHYHSSFSSNGKNRSQWKGYKARLNKKYRRIQVGISGLTVSVAGDTATARFKQRYRSDAFSSDGYKKLQLKREKGGWKILRETSYRDKPPGWPA